METDNVCLNLTDQVVHDSGGGGAMAMGERADGF